MADKRISQLNPHTSPTGSDLLVIVNNNETKKITYADLTAAITGSETDLSALNQFTQSFNTFSASVHTEILAGTNEQDLSNLVTSVTLGVLSGSVDSRLDNLEVNTGSYLTTLPSGLISQSTDLSYLNQFTQSIDSRVDSLESWSSSLDSTFATDLQVSIVSSSVAATIGVISQNTGLLSTSSFNEYTASQSTSSLVDRLNSIENVTSSYESKGSGILSGSISYTDLTNIPDGIVSQSVDIADFTFTNGTITNGEITLHATNSDIVFNADGAVYIGSSNAGNQIITDSYLAGVIGDTEMINNGTGNTISNNLTNIINSIPTIPDGIISGSEQITALGFISSSQTIDTGSLATTGSNTFNGNQTINGSLTINISSGIPTGVSNWNGQGGWNQGFYSNLSTTGGTGTGLTVDVAAGGGGYINISAISINNPGSGYTNGDVITIDNENNLPGTFTIEVGASSLEFDASGSLVFPDATTQTTAFIPATYATTGSNTFNGNETISGSLFISGTTELGGNLVPKSARGATLGTLERPFADIFVSSGSINIASDIPGDPNTTLTNIDGNILISAGGMRLVGDASFIAATGSFNYISGSMTQVGNYTQLGTHILTGNSTISGSLNVTNGITGSIRATNGVISGSSQLTSSYDSRYTLSGSISATPAGTISGSSQITTLGFVSSSVTASSFVSASSNTNVILFTKGDGSTMAVTVATGSGNYVTSSYGTFHDTTTQSGSANTAYVMKLNSTDHQEGIILSGSGGMQILQAGTYDIEFSAQLVNGAGEEDVDIWLRKNGTNVADSNTRLTISSNKKLVAAWNWQDTANVFDVFEIMWSSTGGNSTISAIGASTLPTRPAIPSVIATIHRVDVGGGSNMVTTGSFNTFTSSINNWTSSVELKGSGIYSSSAQLPSGLVSGSSQLTSSYDTRYTLSGSVVSGITPAGTISGSAQISAFGFVSGSYTTTSSFNAFTASAQTVTTGSNSFNGTQIITGSLIVTSGSFIGSQLTANTSSLYLTSGSNLYVQNNGLVEITGSLLATSITGSIAATNGVISGSSQLTASYDTRYTLSGSVVSGTTPAGTISGSTQLTSSFDGRYLVTGSITSSINQLNTFTASISTASLVNRLNTIESVSGSWITESETGSFLTSLNGAISSSIQLTSSFDTRYTLSGSVQPLPSGLISGSSQLTASYDTRYTLSGSTSIIFASTKLTELLSNVSAVTGASTPNSFVPDWTCVYTSSLGSTLMFNGSFSAYSTVGGVETFYLNIDGVDVASTAFIFNNTNFHHTIPCLFNVEQLSAGGHTIKLKIPSGIIVDSSDFMSLAVIETMDSNGVIPSGIPVGTISGSTQLTSSFEEVASGTHTLISGSGQITNLGYATTGSNIFQSGQTINGSLYATSYVTTNNITTTAAGNGTNIQIGNTTYIGDINRTSTLQVMGLNSNNRSGYIKFGSGSMNPILGANNSATLELSGSLVVSGSVNIISTNALQIGTGSGDEGGEILLAKSQTNNSLTGSGITIDSYQNKIRIFEQGGNARGVSIDLSKTPNGVGGELLWKAGGLVNADVDVTLGNLKARIPSTGNRSLQLSTVSGTYSVYGSGVYSFSGISGTTINSGAPLSITTTPAYIVPSYNFTVAGAADTWTLMDTSAGIAWRITMIIGASYNNNMISIERLV